MLSEAGTIIFYDQRFAGATLPEPEDNVIEESRLRAAPVGTYELWFRQQPQYEFGGAFLFNDDRTDAPEKQFELVEEIAETERTLTIQSISDGLNLDSIEIIPLDWRENPLEFTQLAVGEGERTIRYRKDPPPESLKLKVSGINVFDVETINPLMWVNDRMSSPGELATFLRRSEEIRIDRVDNPGGRARKLEEHLQTCLRFLLEKVPDRTFDFDCSYRYSVVSGGPHAFVPVLFRRSLSAASASELFSEVLPELRSWHQNSSPPEGDFDFGVKVFGASPRESFPVLHLTGLVLPIEAIEGWSSSSPI